MPTRFVVDSTDPVRRIKTNSSVAGNLLSVTVCVADVRALTDTVAALKEIDLDADDCEAPRGLHADRGNLSNNMLYPCDAMTLALDAVKHATEANGFKPKPEGMPISATESVILTK